MQCSRYAILDRIKDDFVYNLFTYIVRVLRFFSVVIVAVFAPSVERISRSMKVFFFIDFFHWLQNIHIFISFAWTHFYGYYLCRIFARAINRKSFDTIKWDNIFFYFEIQI